MSICGVSLNFVQAWQEQLKRTKMWRDSGLTKVCFCFLPLAPRKTYVVDCRLPYPGSSDQWPFQKPKIWPYIPYSTSILVSWNSHWSDLGFNARYTAGWIDEDAMGLLKRFARKASSKGFSAGVLRLAGYRLMALKYRVQGLNNQAQKRKQWGWKKISAGHGKGPT